MGKRDRKRAAAVAAEIRHFGQKRKPRSKKKPTTVAEATELGKLSTIAKVSGNSRPTIYSYRADSKYLAAVYDGAVIRPILHRLKRADELRRTAMRLPNISPQEVHKFVQDNWAASGHMGKIPSADGTVVRFHDPNTFAQALLLRGLLPYDLVEAKRRKLSKTKQEES
jgi:hypothetical protein